MNHQTSEKQPARIQMSSSGKYPQILSLQSNEWTWSQLELGIVFY